MDRLSQRAANLALRNAPDAAVLEITVTGPTLECDTAARIAITGAPFTVRVNGEVRQSPLLLEAEVGTTLEFGERLAGARAYLAISGGIDVPVVLGSRSTDLRARFGGFDGRALKAGDRLACLPNASVGRERQTSTAHALLRIRPLPEISPAPLRGAVVRLRVVRGPGRDASIDEAFRTLLQRPYRVSSQSDRMGYRLEGQNTSLSTSGTVVSAPTVTGLVQVPPSGEPVLLMADRQTTGGYAAVAVVIAADLPLAGQLAPGDALQFQACTHDEARRALVEVEARLAAFDTSIA